MITSHEETLKRIGQPKIQNYVIVYSPSCCSKPLWLYFFCSTECYWC